MSDFFDMVRRFLQDYLPKQRCFSENTIRSYKQTLNLFVLYIRTELGISVEALTFSCINRDTILNFLTWLETARKCGVSTRNQRLMALRSFLKFAGQIDCTQTALYLSACNIPSKESHGRIVEFLTEPALTALFQQPTPSKQKELRNLVFMILMYDTAARCGELLDMKVCDLRLDEKHPIAYLHGKGRKTRTVPLMDKTVQHCKRYLEKYHPNIEKHNEEQLFYTIIHGERQKMSADTVASFFAKYGTMARITCPEVPEHIHPHVMRHTRAMHLYRAGMPIELLSQYLGHSQVETTMIYAYADTEMKRAAIQKADAVRKNTPVPDEIWANNEEMILKLAGLT
jgi:site-specific recombinase XerD